MSKVIMGVQLEKRQEAVKEVQSLLTEYGCHIRTRLGIHEASEDSCSEKGLIILEFVSSKQNNANELEARLKALRNVVVKTMVFD